MNLGVSELGDALYGYAHDRSNVTHRQARLRQELDCFARRRGQFLFCFSCSFCGVLVAVDCFEWEPAGFDGDGEAFFGLAGHECGGVFDHGFELVEAARLGSVLAVVDGEVGGPPSVAAGGGCVDVCHFCALLMIAFASSSLTSLGRGSDCRLL